jgi:hypothetical protein
MKFTAQGLITFLMVVFMLAAQVFVIYTFAEPPGQIQCDPYCYHDDIW